jgi:hypothetical protein
MTVERNLGFSPEAIPMRFSARCHLLSNGEGIALPAVPKTYLTTENIVNYLTLFATPSNTISLKYEVNAIAHQLIEELKRCREVKDTTVVRLANKTCRYLQWQQPILPLKLATLIGNCAQLYNDQKIPDETLKEECAYYAKLRPLISAILTRKTYALLTPINEDLLLNTCRYFLLGHNWAGIETEHVRVRYIAPDEGGRGGCWEARLSKWIYPFVRQDKRLS